MPYVKSNIIYSPKKKGHAANEIEYRLKLRHLTFKFRWTFYLLSAQNLEDNGSFMWKYTIFVLVPWLCPQYPFYLGIDNVTEDHTKCVHM